MERRLQEADVLDADAIEQIKNKASDEVAEAIKFADSSEQPSDDQLYVDVYAGEDEYMGKD